MLKNEAWWANLTLVSFFQTDGVVIDQSSSNSDRSLDDSASITPGLILPQTSSKAINNNNNNKAGSGGYVRIPKAPTGAAAAPAVTGQFHTFHPSRQNGGALYSKCYHTTFCLKKSWRKNICNNRCRHFTFEMNYLSKWVFRVNLYMNLQAEIRSN